mgnify:CR=1 FL=1
MEKEANNAAKDRDSTMVVIRSGRGIDSNGATLPDY